MKPHWETSAVFSFRDYHVAKRNAFGFLLPAIAAALLAWWWFGTERVATGPAPVATVGNATAPARSMPAPGSPASEAITPGGFVAPRLDDATPSEIEAMRTAEVERSAGSPLPPATFIGADGKRHAFQYNQSSGLSDAVAISAARDARRALLMQQLRSDPQKFARDNHLAAKEVQWILEGSEDFPDRLLD